MSWFAIFKKSKAQNGTYSPDEIALIESLARAEVEREFGRTPIEPGPTAEKTVKYNREVAKREVFAQSTKRCSVIPLRDWRTVSDVAQENGLALDELDRLTNEVGFSVIKFTYADDLMHMRQVAYYLEYKRLLEVDSTVFTEWKRLADISRDTEVRAQIISSLIADKKLAAYKPHPRIVLVNEREVYAVAAE